MELANCQRDISFIFQMKKFKFLPKGWVSLSKRGYNMYATV